MGRRPTRPSRRNWERELVDRCGFAGVGESIDGWHPYRLADETVDGLAWCRTGPSLAATGELAVLCADIVQPDRMVRKGHLAGYMQWTGSALTGLGMGLKTRHEGVRDR